MATFNKNGLRLIAQGLSGGKIWHYTDTGASADVLDVAGYFTNATELGLDSGDLMLVWCNDGSNTRIIRSAAFGPIQDTGATQGSLGPATVIGDTG